MIAGYLKALQDAFERMYPKCKFHLEYCYALKGLPVL